MNESIKGWYMKNFPDDDLGKEVNDITFEDLHVRASMYGGFWSDYIGVSDTIIREHIVIELQDRIKEWGR